MQSSFENYLLRIDSSFGDKPKSFWKYINKCSYNITGNMYQERRIENTCDEIAELFADYFSSVYLTPVEFIDNEKWKAVP